MTVNELIIELQKEVERGCGSKDIFVEDSQKKRDIDSIQQNTLSHILPDYFCIMAGKWVKK